MSHASLAAPEMRETVPRRCQRGVSYKKIT
ncbi:hypothetical protein AVEN_241422-1, partial [Araneus ventricosus]